MALTQIPSPTLRKEVVQVDALGGEVIVRGLLASERLGLTSEAQQRREQDDQLPLGEEYKPIVRLVAATVLDADGAPVYSEDDWEIFGGQHPDVVLKLFDVAQRLSGHDVEDARKNS